MAKISPNSNNELGIKNVTYNKKNGFYVVTIVRKGEKYLERFTTLRAATKAKHIVLHKYNTGDENWNDHLKFGRY